MGREVSCITLPSHPAWVSPGDLEIISFLICLPIVSASYSINSRAQRRSGRHRNSVSIMGQKEKEGSGQRGREGGSQELDLPKAKGTRSPSFRPSAWELLRVAPQRAPHPRVDLLLLSRDVPSGFLLGKQKYTDFKVWVQACSVIPTLMEADFVLLQKETHGSFASPGNPPHSFLLLLSPSDPKDRDDPSLFFSRPNPPRFSIPYSFLQQVISEHPLCASPALSTGAKGQRSPVAHLVEQMCQVPLEAGIHVLRSRRGQ